MNASDIMTRDVLTASPDTSINDIAAQMLTHHIGALPVLKDGKLVGIVSETDLLRRAETGTAAARPRWVEFFADSSSLATDYIKSHGRKAAHIMSTDVITVSPDTPIATVANTLASHHIKRVPVVESGRLVGIISRANLVQALASQPPPAPSARTDDRQIREALMAELGAQRWAISTMRYNIVVDDGVVHLWGIVGSEAERTATIVAAENTPGVNQVVDHLRPPIHLPP